jgi:hypothetical protein
MPMPRTQEEIEKAAAEASAWLDELDPDTVPGRDATPLRDLRHAFEDHAMTGRRVAEAVAVARAQGFSWGAIGMVLGISKQAASGRYGSAERSPV